MGPDFDPRGFGASGSGEVVTKGGFGVLASGWRGDVRLRCNRVQHLLNEHGMSGAYLSRLLGEHRTLGAMILRGKRKTVYCSVDGGARGHVNALFSLPALYETGRH